VKGVARVTAQTYVATIQGSCCDVPESIVVAFDQESDFVVAPWLTAKLGRKLRRGEAVVGAESAFNIGLGLTEVSGKLFGSIFRIVGVLDRTGTGLDTAIFVDEESVREIFRRGDAKVPPGSISVVFAQVAPGEDPTGVAGRLEDAIVEVDAVARRDVGQGVLRSLGDVRRMFLVTFLLASVLAALLAWAVFSGVATERAREVGLMRAMGAPESYVSRLFLLEVLLVGAAGSTLGVLLGNGLSTVLVKGFAMLRSAPLDLGAADRLAVGALGLVVGTAVCVVGALSPLRSTRRAEPLAVLKGD
jgi:putative ABC transport system permease protein